MKRVVIRGGMLAALLVAFGLALLPRALPSILAWWRPDIFFRGRTDKPRLFVTIDDAPSESTAAILAVLKKHQVPATFFIIGNRVHSDAELSRVVDAGYALGNHLRTTERCGKLSLKRFEKDFDFTDHLLRRFSRPEYFRPPSDLGTKEQMAYAIEGPSTGFGHGFSARSLDTTSNPLGLAGAMARRSRRDYYHA